jgi:predicted MPP superfamily phosphohydrolase
MEKRRVWTTAAALAATSSLAVALDARYRQPYLPVLERIEIPAPVGHQSLVGLRIGFVTDTHIGPFVAERDIERAVAMLLAETPDLVLLGGDYISESPRYAANAAAVLGRLQIAAPLGCLAVLGNHDLSTDLTKVTAALEAVGIRVLRNESVRVDAPGGPLWIAGIDEIILGNADVAKTFTGIPRDAAVIALWHEPDGAAEAAARGAFAQLSGHSHGGQIRLPGIGPLALPPGGQLFPAGPYQIGPMTLYTARGAGVYRPAVRLNCPPEVTLITLTA